MNVANWIVKNVTDPFFAFLKQPETYVMFVKILFIAFLIIAALAYYLYGTKQEHMM